MKINSIKIKNFRCYGENMDGEWGVIFRPKKGLNLLIGTNGSGKTTIADAIDITMNADGRSNQALVTEYDFPNCDTKKNMCIEIILTDIGSSLSLFESYIQWIDPEDGEPIEKKGEEIDKNKHQRAVVIRFEAKIDPDDGEMSWKWFLPKFPETELEQMDELNKLRHQAFGYFRIRPVIAGGAFTLSQYSGLGRYLKKLQYRLGKLPEKLKSEMKLPECLLGNLHCEDCSERTNCKPSDEIGENSKTIGQQLQGIIFKAKKILGTNTWNTMDANLGPRYGGLNSSLSALTLGLLTDTDNGKKFLPFERFSTGEKYALSFALARAQVFGKDTPIIVMEEPETALYPSAIATILSDLQFASNSELPQIIITSHSETVLRQVLPEDIFIMGNNRHPNLLKKVIDKNIQKQVDHERFLGIEYFLMSGESSVFFADKVLIVEGQQDVVLLKELERLCSNNINQDSQKHISFSSQGWCIFHTNGADHAENSIKVLSDLGKKVSVLFDGDVKGLENAEKTKSLCSTFVYKSSKEKEPRLEEAFLLGLLPQDQSDILGEYYSGQSCLSCSKRKGKNCWQEKGGNDCYLGNRDERKRCIQKLCIKKYSGKKLFPPAFKLLLEQIDIFEKGNIHEILVDAQDSEKQ